VVSSRKYASHLNDSVSAVAAAAHNRQIFGPHLPRLHPERPARARGNEAHAPVSHPG